MSDKKELVSERDLYEWYNETESMFGFWMSYVAKKINQRHEERMKEIAIDFAEYWAAEKDNPEGVYLSAQDAWSEWQELNQQSDE